MNEKKRNLHISHFIPFFAMMAAAVITVICYTFTAEKREFMDLSCGNRRGNGTAVVSAVYLTVRAYVAAVCLHNDLRPHVCVRQSGYGV